MPTIHLEAEVSRESLLKAVSRLDLTELDELVTDLLNLRAKRGADRLSSTESELFARINEGLPDELRDRYRELIGRRDHESLSAEEHAELLSLTDEVERRESSRVEALAELSRMRGMSISSLMQLLGLPARSDG